MQKVKLWEEREREPPDDELFAAINEDTGAQRINNTPMLLCGVSCRGDLLAHLQQ